MRLLPSALRASACFFCSSVTAATGAGVAAVFGAADADVGYKNGRGQEVISLKAH